MFKEVHGKLESLIDHVRSAETWSEIVEDESIKKGLSEPFNSIKRNLSVIQESLDKRPSIAIFGESQVGKSYLVQNLAKPSDIKYLKIKKNSIGDEANFLTEINPDGSKESTGLVTRFTTENITTDEEFPFKVEFFTQMDIAAILSNAFCSDLTQLDESVYDFGKEELDNLWSRIIEKEKQEGIGEYEVYFFNEYIKEHFSDFALIRELEKIGYFKDLESKIQFVKPEDRWKVLQFLWGKNIFFIEIFKKLSQGIQELNFRKKGRFQFNALSPKKNSIIDVERVREIFDSENDDFLKIKTDSGSINHLPRSVFSVLAKEVVLELGHSFDHDSSQSFLNTADLLDFPGSKSREKIPIQVFNNKNKRRDKLQLLIRGKVSYLFDSYVKNLGVSTLLYCMHDSPPGEKDAPSRLYKWVSRYVGKNKEIRSSTLSKTRELLKKINPEIEHISPLIVAFTKFNQELAKDLQDENTTIEFHNSKWEARYGENFSNFLMRPVEDKWLTNWENNEQNFKYVFPIRDPIYSTATFEGLATTGIETGIRPECKESMQDMGTSFTGSELVNKFTLQPMKVWDEIRKPNGSGIKLLAKQLKYSAHTIVTETRLNVELDRLKNELLNILMPYLISGDLNEDLRKASKNSLRAYTSLIAIANKQNSPLNNIMSHLIISDTEIWNLLYENIFRAQTKPQSNGDNNGEINIDLQEFCIDYGLDIKPGTDESTIINDIKDNFPGLSDDDVREVVESSLGIGLDDLVLHLNKENLVSGSENNETIDLIIAYWIERIMHTALNENLFFGMTANQEEAFRGLLSEIIKSKERFNLKGVLGDKITDITRGSISRKDIDLVANCSTAILNKFLFTAGWGFSKEDEKPEIADSGNKIYSTIGRQCDKADLNYSSSSTKEFFTQWIIGIKEIYGENVRYKYNIDEDVNTIANDRLKDTILDLQKG